MIKVPGTVTIRWRETKRWHELELPADFAPETPEQAVRFAALRLVWQGLPLVEARQIAQHYLVS